MTANLFFDFHKPSWSQSFQNICMRRISFHWILPWVTRNSDKSCLQCLHRSNLWLKVIRTLTTLWVSQYIDDQCLLHLSTHCSMLEHLGLRNCNKVTDNGTQHLARGCHGLKSLDLGECHHITRKSLQYLSEGCFLLEYLSLSFCVNIRIQDLTIIVNCENMVNKLHNTT